MDWVSAPNIEDAPAEPARIRFSLHRLTAAYAAIEAFLERERAQLPLWFTVAFGTGVAAWLWLPGPARWGAFILLALGLAATGVAVGAGRIGRALLFGCLAMAAGCALIWWRSDGVAAPRLDRPAMATFEGRVEKVETRAAKGYLRRTLGVSVAKLPPLVRVSLP